jgi:hypothetical protein
MHVQIGDAGIRQKPLEEAGRGLAVDDFRLRDAVVTIVRAHREQPAREHVGNRVDHDRRLRRGFADEDRPRGAIGTARRLVCEGREDDRLSGRRVAQADAAGRRIRLGHAQAPRAAAGERRVVQRAQVGEGRRIESANSEWHVGLRAMRPCCRDARAPAIRFLLRPRPASGRG